MTSQNTKIDKYIGSAIKTKRLLANRSLKDIGDILGISFQQMQKYEKGTNRLSSSYLFQLSEYLDTPLDSFFPKHKNNLEEAQEPFDITNVSEYELSNLIKYYSSISSKNVRKKILDLIKSLAE